MLSYDFSLTAYDFIGLLVFYLTLSSLSGSPVARFARMVAVPQQDIRPRPNPRGPMLTFVNIHAVCSVTSRGSRAAEMLAFASLDRLKFSSGAATPPRRSHQY